MNATERNDIIDQVCSMVMDRVQAELSELLVNMIDGRIAASKASEAWGTGAPSSQPHLTAKPQLPADAPLGCAFEWRVPKAGDRVWVRGESDLMTWFAHYASHTPQWVLVPPVPAANPVPAPGQVWGDAHRQILVLSGGTGVVLAGMDTWIRGTWLSLVEAGRVLRENGYRYIGEAVVGVKGKD